LILLAASVTKREKWNDKKIVLMVGPRLKKEWIQILCIELTYRECLINILFVLANQLINK
jgi:hypothetical protein